MSRNYVVYAGVILLILLIGVWAYWRFVFLPRHSENQTVQTTSYFLFTEKDNGRTTPVTFGGEVVVTFAPHTFGEPVTAQTAEGISLPVTFRTDLGTDTVASFSISKTSRIIITAKAIDPEKPPFSLTLIPH